MLPKSRAAVKDAATDRLPRCTVNIPPQYRKHGGKEKVGWGEGEFSVIRFEFLVSEVVRQDAIRVHGRWKTLVQKSHMGRAEKRTGGSSCFWKKSAEGGDGPVGGREDYGPEIAGGTIEFKGHAVEVHAILFNAHDAAAHFLAVLRIVEEEGLADVEVLTETQESPVGVDHLGFGLFLDLLAVFVFGDEVNSDAQHDAFTATAILWRGHR